ncbi:Cysteine desulfurase IscS [Fusobacterium sp. DD26]|nr:Cysteine desulfurase IscS [Fusobacterium sp. DD45]MBR8711351.1 Cysteine desulfurase IscS [Fusobacterium sp. DD28]MBR8751900.1 Cysteine desulfurase IscS [Fusobacterium sp. DD26]
MIYADNAATTKLDLEVFERMKPFLLDEYANASQPYSFARLNKKTLKKAREIIASCINAEPEEILFTSCGTESDNWAIKGTMLLSDKGTGIITSEIEHHAVLNPCHTMEKLGHPVKYLKVEKDGKVALSTLKNSIDTNDKLVSIMMANNEIGTIQDIKELCKIAHEKGLIFHTDAVQTLGHIPIDVKELNIDLLSASAHKFNGPKGIGFMFIKKGTEILSFIEGGSQENSFRAGTENIAFIYGMALALEKNCKNIEKNREHLKKLEEVFLDTLNKGKIDYICNGGNDKIPGNINISIKNEDGEKILHRLDLMKICISTGSACNGKYNTISHVIRAIGVPEDYAKGTIRISLGHDNTENDVKEIAKAILKIVG